MRHAEKDVVMVPASAIGSAARVTAVVVAAAMLLVLVACGSSSRHPAAVSTLLSQTFGAGHTVTSGTVSLALRVDRAGAGTPARSTSVSLAGPFESPVDGTLPRSDLTLTFAEAGRSVSVGLLWTGTAGYLSYRGTSYRLPPEVARRLQGSFATMAGSAGAGRGAATVGQLGLHPVSWVVRPTVLGVETVDGTATTHIRASIDAAALVRDVATALARASALGALGGLLPASPSAGSERQQLADRIRQGTFDVWTGTSDRTVRKLALALTVPGTGGGQGQRPGSWARVAFTLQYAGLGRPQTIVAPRAARPTATIPPELAVELQSLDASVAATPAPPR